MKIAFICRNKGFFNTDIREPNEHRKDIEFVFVDSIESTCAHRFDTYMLAYDWKKVENVEEIIEVIELNKKQ